MTSTLTALMYLLYSVTVCTGKFPDSPGKSDLDANCTMSFRKGFSPTTSLKQTYRSYQPFRGSETMVKTLRGGLLVAKDDYDFKELQDQLGNKTYKLNEDSRNRFFYSLHRHLADYMNLSLDVKLFFLNETGDNEVQLMDGLRSLKIDVAISPVVTHWRKAEEFFVDYLPAFETVKYGIVLKQPRRIQSTRALIIQLRAEVWQYLGSLGVLSAVTLYVIQRIFASTHSSTVNEFSTAECTLMVISAFAQQGLPITPANNSGRIVCAFVLILGLMTSTYYNAATVNALLTHASQSIQTIEQIIASGSRIVFQDDPVLRDPATRFSAVPETIWYHPSSRRETIQIDQGLDFVLKGNALCGETNALYAGLHRIFTDLDKCDASFMPTSTPLLARSYVRKGWPYREMMFRGSLRLKEHGLIDRQSRYWFPPKPTCTANPKWMAVDLAVTTVAISIILCGLIISFVFFLLEKCFQALSIVLISRKEHDQ